MPRGYASFIPMACCAAASGPMPRLQPCVPTCASQHMQKAMMEINLQLHHVVSDITGATGMRIIPAIVAGERNPDVLATYRDVRWHSSAETIRAALVGNDRDEHVFTLSQSLELYDVYQTKMLDCDCKLEVIIVALSSKGAQPVGKLSKPRIKSYRQILVTAGAGQAAAVMG
ncbi:hypothetical protein ABIB75_007191 [Bradyrhizobium sp. GM2.2]|uniref:hypothetical protein n=1 Tax=Bradyrhizobium sp. GM2.2 TaxID=3156358 RepID=UPI003397D952